MADENGNGTKRLWTAYGILVTVAIAWAGWSVRTHAEYDRALNDRAILLGQMQRDLVAERDRVSTLERQIWINTGRIGVLEQQTAALEQYVYPGETKIYKRHFRDNGEQIR